MTETVKYAVENELGCGFMNTFFQNSIFGQRKSPTKPLLPSYKKNVSKVQSIIDKSINKPLPRINQNPSPNPVFVSSKCNFKSSQIRPSDSAIISTSSSSNSLGLRRESLSRASSGNIINSSAKSLKPLDLDKPIGASLISGNILRRNSGKMSKFGNIYRGVTILDPEVVKNMGNEKYKMGRFSEALAMYNQAISLDPNNAVYYCNKGAALISLGRLIEAVFECREAIRIDPSYHRAHYRLATLYFRPGEAEKAQHHYTLSELKASSDDIAKSRALKRHLSACQKAIEIKNWDLLLNESQHAIFLGADSAPQINAMKVDALLNLHKHKEANKAFEKELHFDTGFCFRLFGGARCAYILTVRAQVYIVVGRFEEALSAAQQASRLDTSYKTNAVLNRVKAVSLARLKGNKFFKASNYSEAVVAYNEGLKLDTYNSVLLFNRATCEFNLGQFEEAVEDCTVALNVRPCYIKARLRRANCYSKLGKWKSAIEDFEMLVRDTPNDKESAKYLLEARSHINRNIFIKP